MIPTGSPWGKRLLNGANEGVFEALNAFLFTLSTNMHYSTIRQGFALNVSGLKRCFAKPCLFPPYVWRCFLSPTGSAMRKASLGSFSTTLNQTLWSLKSRVLSWSINSKAIHLRHLQSHLPHKPRPQRRRRFSLQDTLPLKQIIAEPRLLLRSARHPP